MSTAEILAELPRLSSADRAMVEAKLKELAESSRTLQSRSIAAHPALGIWKGRTDLPEDSIQASKQLRERMMRRSDAIES